MARYQVLAKNEYLYWLKDCPVQVQRTQISLDTQSNQRILQLRMANISNKMIQSVYFEVICMDDAQDELGTIPDLQFQQILAAPGQEFGANEAIVLNQMSAMSVKICIRKVVFEDGTLWRNQEGEMGIRISKTPITLFHTEYKEALERELASIEHPYSYEEHETYWMCVCGQANSVDSPQCCRCKASRSILKRAFGKDYLEEQEKKYQEGLRRQREEERLELERRQQEWKAQEEIRKQEKAAKKTKRRSLLKKLVPAAAGIICAAALIVCAYQFILKPSGQYNKAQQLLNEGQYDEAAAEFEALGDYKDSEDMIWISKIRKIYGTWHQGKIGDRMEELNQIKKEVAQRDNLMEEIYKVQQQVIQECFDGEHYSEMVQGMEVCIKGSLNNEEQQKYEQWNEQYRESAYSSAQQFLEQGKYNQALSIFRDLGDYKDSPQKRLISSCKQLQSGGITIARYSTIENKLEEIKKSDGMSEEVLPAILEIEEAVIQNCVDQKDYATGNKYLKKFLEDAYSDTETRQLKEMGQKLTETVEQKVDQFLKAGQYDQILKFNQEMGGITYKDDPYFIDKCYYHMAQAYQEKGAYGAANVYYDRIEHPDQIPELEEQRRSCDEQSSPQISMSEWKLLEWEYNPKNGIQAQHYSAEVSIQNEQNYLILADRAGQLQIELIADGKGLFRQDVYDNAPDVIEPVAYLPLITPEEAEVEIQVITKTKPITLREYTAINVDISLKANDSQQSYIIAYMVSHPEYGIVKSGYTALISGEGHVQDSFNIAPQFYMEDCQVEVKGIYPLNPAVLNFDPSKVEMDKVAGDYYYWCNNKFTVNSNKPGIAVVQSALEDISGIQNQYTQVVAVQNGQGQVRIAAYVQKKLSFADATFKGIGYIPFRKLL